MIFNLSKLNLIQLILLVLLITGAINFAIFFFDIHGTTSLESNSKNFFFPSSKIIGTVWTLLMIGLAYTFSIVSKSSKFIAKGVIILFLLCVSYPIYTLGFSSVKYMILGNLITIFYSSFIVGRLFDKYKELACVVSLIPIWVIYVTYLMFNIY